VKKRAGVSASNTGLSDIDVRAGQARVAHRVPASSRTLALLPDALLRRRFVKAMLVANEFVGARDGYLPNVPTRCVRFRKALVVLARALCVVILWGVCARRCNRCRFSD